MTDFDDQQINNVFQTHVDIPIYDQDNWLPEQDTPKPSSNKSITLNDKVQNLDANLIKKIDKELENSKENFFKVKITKTQNPKKIVNPTSKSLKKIDTSISQRSPHTVLKQGYMEKKTDSFIFRWKTRYFALTCEKLYFFQDNKKQKVIGCVNLKLLPVQVKKTEEEIVLDFCGETENMILRCESKKQSEEWIRLINQVVKFQSKSSKLLLKTMIKPLYECQDSITEKEYNKIAETGDVLLFYTRNTGAKLQRVITNSDFDHVAMVVKFGRDQTMVFQSNQTYGVSIFDWNQYIRFFNLYDKVTLRKLHSARKQEMHHTLLNFVKKNLGKKYDITAMKLLKLQSDFNWDQVNNEEARGFFCSELIAKAYKSVGILDPKKSSGRYWPVDFSQKGEMMLKNGAYLGPQQSIILNRHIKNTL